MKLLIYFTTAIVAYHGATALQPAIESTAAYLAEEMLSVQQQT